MSEHVIAERRGRVGTITLNRPERLNAWDQPMRARLVALLDEFDKDDGIGAIILTGAGNRAFCAGQDLNEAKSFDADRAALWIEEWRMLYGRIRSLSKPLVIALNGLAAGSAFQVALLGDFRIGHPGVKMGQPEINSGIASTLGPWIMKEILGLARTIDLTLTGRMMEAEECRSLGLINDIVPEKDVMSRALALCEDLASKPAHAMRLNKSWFRELTQSGFDAAFAAGTKTQRESYGGGEPGRVMEEFLAKRRRSGT